MVINVENIRRVYGASPTIQTVNLMSRVDQENLKVAIWASRWIPDAESEFWRRYFKYNPHARIY